MKMKIAWMWGLCVLLMLTTRLTGVATTLQTPEVNRATFYSAMKSENIDEVEQELAVVIDINPGYAGALMIRKASLVTKVKEKLKLFKAGKAQLETAIANHPENTEYRFLRLSIQEHAPRIVGYKSGLKADKAFLIKHFSQLPLLVQRTVLDYCSKSKILKPADFNTDHS